MPSRRTLRLLAVFVALLGVCCPAHAASDSRNGTALDRLFFEALSDIGQNKFPQASARFVELKTLASQTGYENMSGFSLTLLERTEVLLANADREKAGFVLRWAKELSPDDARVILGVARFTELVPFGERLSLTLAGFWKALCSPVVSTTIGVNTLLIGLTALSIALVFVCIFQFARRGDIVFQVVGRFVQPNARGVFGPIMVFAVLFLPVLLGVMFAVVCWSLLLAKIYAPGRKVALMASLLTIVWGLSLPVLNISLGNSASKLAWILEGRRINSYVPHGSNYLAPMAGKQGDPLLRFAFAESLFFEGNTVAARENYEDLLAQVGEESAFGKVVRFHLATLSLHSQEYAEAHEAFEKLEPSFEKSFEFAYNFSLLRLKELDTEGQRKYFERARELDGARLARLENDAKDKPAALLISAPAGQYLPFLLKLHDMKKDKSAMLGFGRARKVASALVIGATPSLLVLLGFCAGCIAFCTKPEFVKFDSPESGTSIWNLVPGGKSISGRAPAAGAAILALFVGLLLAGAETPVHLVPIVPLSRGSASTFYLAALCVMLLSIIMGLLPKRRRSS